MSAATGWCQRFARPIREFARFAVVGATGFLVTDAAFNLMISERQARMGSCGTGSSGIRPTPIRRPG